MTRFYLHIFAIVFLCTSCGSKDDSPGTTSPASDTGNQQALADNSPRPVKFDSFQNVYCAIDWNHSANIKGPGTILRTENGGEIGYVVGDSSGSARATCNNVAVIP